MQYRKLGNTGLMVSALGFGCMRLPKIPGDPQKVDRDASGRMFKRAVELGVNYFDTAYIYNNGDSERAIGSFFKEIDRKKVIVTTKSPIGHPWSPISGSKSTGAQFRACLEEELKRLDTDYIDKYLFHDTRLLTFRIIINAPDGPLAEAKKAKKEGLIHHIGISCHDTPRNIIKIVEMANGKVELIIVQYNLLDRKNELAINYARDHGMGVAVMGPVGGGRLIHPSSQYVKAVKTKSTPELAIRFVLSNPGVSTAMSGMNTMEQLEENAAAASLAEPLSKEELAAVDELQKKNKRLLNLYCTGCRYCMPCPNGIDIPGNFTAMNLLKVHGLAALAKQSYERLGEGKAEKCVKCGECAGKCPQNIEIQERLAEVAEAFREIA